MTNRPTLIAEARSWEGTPYHPQAHNKGVGASCAGLLYGLAIHLPWLVPGFSLEALPDRWRCYGELPNGELMEACDALLVATDVVLPGDVLLFKWKPEWPAQHCGIYLGPGEDGDGRLLHAYNKIKMVKETRMGGVWWRRFCKSYTWPGLAAT